jgi:hypothetical protein
MRTLASTIALLVLTLVLAGCGSGNDDGCGSLSGGSGTSGTGTTSTCTSGSGTANTTPAAVKVSSTASSIVAGGTTGVTITAVVTNSAGTAVSGATVSFSASGGLLSASTATTNSSGQATTTLTPGTAASGASITITATAGSVSGTASVSVTSGGGTGGTSNNITLLTSSPQMASNNSAPVTITAIVQNTSNQIVPGVAVNFTASSGAIAPTQTTAGKAASVVAGTTDANGEAQATLTTPGNAANRTITVTAQAGSFSQTATVAVVGTTLTLSGPSSVVLNAPGSYTLTLLDSGGVGIANQAITLASSAGNTLPSSVTTTSPGGTATFSYTGVTSGTDTITATSEGTNATEQVTVSNQNFTITSPTGSGTSLVVGTTSQQIAVSWTASGTGQNGTVNFATTRGALSLTPAQITVTNGVEPPTGPVVTISSTTAGPATLSATAYNNSGAIVATADLNITFVAGTPTAISVQANPSTINIQGQSTITATVTDSYGNPVAGKSVAFTLTTDPTGGSISPASATTDAAGVATVTYTGGATSSPAGGVKITAQEQSTQISNYTDLTVGNQAASLKLGFSTIYNYDTAATQYGYPITVQVFDSSGNPVNGVSVSFTVTSIQYGMGQFAWDVNASPKQWDFQVAASGNTAGSTFGPQNCTPVTVQTYDGLIDPATPPAGSTLVNLQIPGDVAAPDANPVETAGAGTASMNLVYQKYYASWVTIVLTATATVEGSQNSSSLAFTLPVSQADDQNSAAPAWVSSPFGGYPGYKGNPQLTCWTQNE